MMRPLFGLLLCALVLLAAIVDAHAALSGWLTAFVLVSSLPLGGLCLSMMLRIIPGPWRLELAGPSTEAMALAPALVALALPIMVGMPWLYPWFEGGLTGFKAIYLAPAFFGIRLLAILIGAAVLGFFLRLTESYRLAVAGLIAFVALHGLLATDLVLSLTPEFHSSGFGLYLLGLQMLTALAMFVLRSLPHSANPSLLGQLLLTALLLWAYFSFMQYFISWSDNLVPAVRWYHARGYGIWAIAEYAMAALRLAPGLLLLFPPIRASRSWLAALCSAILLGGAIETAWLVLPSAGTTSAIAFLAYLSALAGMLLIAPAAHLLPFMRRRLA
jgi:hypothetical protein